MRDVLRRMPLLWILAFSKKKGTHDQKTSTRDRTADRGRVNDIDIIFNLSSTAITSYPSGGIYRYNYSLAMLQEGARGELAQKVSKETFRRMAQSPAFCCRTAHPVQQVTTTTTDSQTKRQSSRDFECRCRCLPVSVSGGTLGRER